MTNCYLKVVLTIHRNSWSKTANTLLITMAAIFFTTTAAANCAKTLTAYTATYEGSSNGIKGKMTRSLSENEKGEWQMQNKAKVLFFTFEEHSQFAINNHQIIPYHYRYENPVSGSKDRDMIFDWQKRVAIDSKMTSKPIPLQANMLDRLTVINQTRLDLLKSCGKYSKKHYQIVDNEKIKTYIVEPAGKATLETPIGKLEVIKLKQTEPGKNKHTMLWFAPAKDYLLVRFDAVEADKTDTISIISTNI